MMNVFIMTDLEGVSCVEREEQMRDEGYAFACQRLMFDLNAAVQGAFDGGAHKVYVCDGHGGGQNFIEKALHPKALRTDAKGWQELIRASEIDAYMEIGCHAMAGTLNGFLDHTMSSVKWHDYFINGRKSGEIAIGALFAGAFGVPMTMVSGDEAACAEAKKFLGEDIAVASVKTGVGRNEAKCLSSDEAFSRIKAAARLGVITAKEIRPFSVSMPAEIILEYNRSDYCEEAYESCLENVVRLDARRLCKTVESIEWYRDLFF